MSQSRTAVPETATTRRAPASAGTSNRSFWMWTTGFFALVLLLIVLGMMHVISVPVFTSPTSLVGASLWKLSGGAAAILVVAAVLFVVFFIAGQASGRVSRPVGILVFLGPAALFMLVGLVIPAIRTFMLSFYDASGQAAVGFDNYAWAFTNSNMQTVLINTVLWLAIAPTASTAFGLVLALLADRMGKRSESATKSLIFLPMAISFVGASVIWKFVYEYKDPAQPQIGLLSQMCIWLGWKNPPNWLLTTPLNTFMLIVIMVWVQTGFAMVVLSAAIKAIPTDVLEAASLDGATGWQMFVRVTIPMIRGTLIVVFTTILIAVLKIFDIVATMTGGNFNTSVLSYEMYRQTFVQGDQGHGSALAVILFVGVVPVLIYNIMQLRKERAVR
ncbi:sugar ABC transporter permease [Actinotalea sp. M2MS4P-6]|uniref:carbohydrate ABC transporter permease n=1 Tax=Actinotalea sp. M2MS4P-6 TaxID=2983762 RepID=UPI0021E41769|nr:sugar ABC transporter permease [Actinotalea sp. M2MS4P-6]MCV2395294.1 sugar ABC transporter permease [Actinotalea sp. M2MS4P-6]